MKRLAIGVLVLAMSFCLFGCGGESEQQKSSGGAAEQQSSNEPAPEEQKQPLDLIGTWKQANPNSEDMWQEAVIEGDAITINWISDGGDTKSLYWAGTYVAPTESADSYSWTSENYKEQTSSAMLASGDDTKVFTYENGVLSYEASALGTTTTVKLERL